MQGVIYLGTKTLHIIAIISWMAGILYFYRLFVYHREHGEKSEEIQTLLTLMEIRLFRYITLPAMIVSVLSGAGLVYLNLHFLRQGWFHIKLFSVLLMILVTLNGFPLIKRFQSKDYLQISGLQLRIMNEVPTLLMVIIVAMVVFRPL